MLDIANSEEEAKLDSDMEKMFMAAEVVNNNYLKRVKPIFVKKCFDCHSNQTVFPWYHSLPIVKEMLDKDIAEAKKHLNLSDDFPFEGHGSAEEDLKAIKDDVNKNEMPPFKYWIAHPGSRLTSIEKKMINEWVDSSLILMNSKK
jgi:hypothetical protein